MQPQGNLQLLFKGDFPSRWANWCCQKPAMEQVCRGEQVKLAQSKALTFNWNIFWRGPIKTAGCSNGLYLVTINKCATPCPTIILNRIAQIIYILLILFYWFVNHLRGAEFQAVFWLATWFGWYFLQIGWNIVPIQIEQMITFCCKLSSLF